MRREIRQRSVDAVGAPSSWDGAWILDSRALKAKSVFLAKKVFRLQASPARCVVHVAADCRYALFCNGVLVGRGPVRATHRRLFYDSYDLGDLLRPGENVLAAAVMVMGRSTFGYIEATPGLLVQGCAMADGERVDLDSDTSWRVRPSEAYDPAATLFTQQVGWSEWYRADREDAGWTDASLEGWRAADAISLDDALGGRRLEARMIPPLLDTPVTAVAAPQVFAVPPCDDAEAMGDYARLMHEEPHAAAPPGTAQGLDTFIEGEGALTVQPPGTGRGVGILLDMGRLYSGYLAFEVEGPAGAVMDMGYNESLLDDRLPTVAVVEGPVGLDYHFADRYVFGEGRREHVQLFCERSARYTQIVLRGFDAPVQIHRFELVRNSYPVEKRGSFRCSDPSLDELRLAAARTLQLSMRDVYMDCPWREQALYTGDMYNEALFEHTAFGDGALTRQCLLMAADGMMERGLLPCAYPSEGRLTIPSYSLLWVLALDDYVHYTADLSVIEPCLGVVKTLMETFEGQRAENGLLRDFDGEFNFFDWGFEQGEGQCALQREGQCGPLSLMYVGALRAAAGLAERAGDAGLARDARARAGRTAEAVNRNLWDAARRAYVDFAGPAGPRACSVSQHTNALALCFGVADGDRIAGALDALTAPDGQVLQAEPFFQLFVLDALARGGRMDRVLEVLRERFAPMLRGGTGTLWEMWCGKRGPFQGVEIDCFSLCHGWSANMLYLAPTYLLGVEPLEDGYHTFRCAPQLGDLDFAQGAVPTPAGVIEVSWTNGPREFTLSIAMPPDRGMTCELSVPVRGRSAVIRDATQTERSLEYPSMRLPQGKYTVTVEK